jgi:hypothetical protein
MEFLTKSFSADEVDRQLFSLQFTTEPGAHMDPQRKRWNENHQLLTRLLAKGDREAAIPLFLDQHAMVHSARVSKAKLWSFEDELLDDMSEVEIRQVPAGGEHSIAWILFHLARIEDITMNLLVAGTPQILTSDDWAKRLNVSLQHSANKMDDESMAALSAQIDIPSLRRYRVAVARRTRQVVQGLGVKDFKRRVDPARIETVLREGAVTPEAREITDYWGKKTIAGLLLMPPTRHCILHLNEANRIKESIRRGLGI